MYQGSCSGVIARKVLIRMALLQRETLTDIKKSHIKLFKVALFDCTQVNKNYCNVD